MSGILYYTFFSSPFGEICLSATERGLFYLQLSKPEEKFFETIAKEVKVELRRDENFFEPLIVDLCGYFAGIPVNFNYPLDLRGTTAFERAVWERVRRIPYGQVRSYSWIAKELGKPKAARAVGLALKFNPLPIIIPCHRVIRKNGSLGGFSGGLEWKKKLLALERGELKLL
ncbi:MAG: methylated-DNA--[protein]-cysteine S-methyltransferase [Candidatus Edwardsbacteria bacterium]